MWGGERGDEWEGDGGGDKGGGEGDKEEGRGTEVEEGAVDGKGRGGVGEEDGIERVKGE